MHIPAFAWIALTHISVQPPSTAIPPGAFHMGCAPADRECEAMERPRHRVTITKGFRMATTETTVGQFRAFVDATDYRTSAEIAGEGRYWDFETGEWAWFPGLFWARPYDRDTDIAADMPAAQISWSDAEAFCDWAGGRLPTEAEWEYAARGGREGEIYFWGNEKPPLASGELPINAPDRATRAMFPSFETFADYDDGFARAAPVGSFAANGYGLYDMAGNVYEWTADWIADGPYPADDAIDPKGVQSSEIKALRSGGWGYPPQQMRLAFRGLSSPDFWTATFGFRCVWPME